MKKHLSICLFILDASLKLYSQNAPSIEWEKSLGGSNNEAAYSIQQSTDGGFIVAGYSKSDNGDVSENHGLTDYWIVKLTSTGHIKWQKSLGGSDYDDAYSIQQTTDGGFIVAGISYSNDGDVSGNHGQADYWVVKLDSSGNVQWQKSLGGSNVEVLSSVGQTTDGGFIVCGWSDSNDGDITGHHGSAGFADYWIVKLDSVGSIQWEKSLGGSDEDYGSSVQQTSDGGFILLQVVPVQVTEMSLVITVARMTGL